mgnify:FL=1
MSGHSKWNNIKRKKEAADAKKGAVFTKIGREIQVAVREGGPDPESNSKLKDVIDKAKSNNMPNDNITRSITKAPGGGDGEDYEEIIYEGYGPSGVAVIVRALSNNRNRTAAEVRHAFDKNGGNLGTSGCVSFMFEQKGQIYINGEGLEEDDVVMAALEAGADDVENLDGDAYLISTVPDDYSAVRDYLKKENFPIEEASLGPVANSTVTLKGEDIKKMQHLIEQLEDSDDVQDVWHNWENEDEAEED